MLRLELGDRVSVTWFNLNLMTWSSRASIIQDLSSAALQLCSGTVVPSVLIRLAMLVPHEAPAVVRQVCVSSFTIDLLPKQQLAPAYLHAWPIYHLLVWLESSPLG